MPDKWVLSALAKSFLVGQPTIEDIVSRGARTLGKRWYWLRPLARRYVEAMAGQTRPRHREVVQFLLDDPGVRRAISKHFREISVDQWLADAPRMQPVPAAGTWAVPILESAGALADWFWLDPSQLEWFADLKGLGRKNSRAPLRHYHYRILANKSGNIRLIEAPKPRLKRLQRQILEYILDAIPPHPAAHGFVKGRSIQTFIAPHVGQQVVLRMDLRDFSPSLAGARIQSFFRTVGYPESVADLLGGICTNAVPRGA